MASKAGALYALIVFMIGCTFGTVRMLLIAPHVGGTAATILETPIMLGASWLVCRWCVDRLDVSRRVGPRSLMGVVAFVVLMAEEFALGRLVFGRSMSQQLAAYGAAPGTIGLVAQIVFATFPVMQVWRR
jgi:hypothetical protein